MKEVYISKLSQFIDYIEKLKVYYPSNVMFNNPAMSSFLYRGISNSSFKLLPSVFREVEYDDNGLLIKNSRYLEWASELQLLRAFIHEASGYLTIPATDLAKWAEYAQHYGVPTRFLDWSLNPLVALYFACKVNPGTEGAVWLLHERNYEHFISRHLEPSNIKTKYELITELLSGDSNFEFPILYSPYYVDARMSSQKSFFLVWGTKKEAFEDILADEHLYMDLPENDDGNRFYGLEQNANSLFRFLIYPDRKQPLLHELDTVGINEKTLFPGLEGIGRYIERQFRFDYNESIENS